MSKVTVDDITALNNYESKFFDNVICISSLSYLNSLEDVVLAVNELVRITKPNRRLNICVMNDKHEGSTPFNIIIPKALWCKYFFCVSEMNILDIDFPKFKNRYSVYITK